MDAQATADKFGAIVESRIYSRRRIRLPAKISFGAASIALDCTIRDLSVTGARVAIPDAVSLPEHVVLIDPHNRLAFDATVKWRRATLIGLAFDAAISLDKPLNSRLLVLAIHARRAQVDWGLVSSLQGEKSNENPALRDASTVFDTIKRSMPPREEGEEDKCGQRVTDRRKALLIGKIVYGEAHHTLNCTIRNFTDRGARVRVHGSIPLPHRFLLLNIRQFVAFEAEMQWRSDDELGLSFGGSFSLDDASTPRNRQIRQIAMEARRRLGS